MRFIPDKRCAAEETARHPGAYIERIGIMNPTRRDFLKSALISPALAYVQDPKPAANQNNLRARIVGGKMAMEEDK